MEHKVGATVSEWDKGSQREVRGSACGETSSAGKGFKEEQSPISAGFVPLAQSTISSNITASTITSYVITLNVYKGQSYFSQEKLLNLELNNFGQDLERLF